MQHHEMYINFQQNRVDRSVIIVHTNLYAKNCKLHKFTTCNTNFEKSRLSDMHYPLTDIQANFEINRHMRYQITAKKEIISTDDRRTDKQQADRHTDRQTDRQQTDRQTDRQTGRQTERQTDGQTDRRTDVA